MGTGIGRSSLYRFEIKVAKLFIKYLIAEKLKTVGVLLLDY